MDSYPYPSYTNSIRLTLLKGRDDVNIYTDQIEEFVKDFYENGPGSVGENLDLGVQMLEEYGVKFNVLLADKDVMKNTSALFEMPQESYTLLDDAYKEYHCLRSIYDLYLRQKSARDDWAKTLWSELEPQLLLEGMDSFIKEFKQIPKACRSVPIALVLNMQMKKFKNSIPLFIELKNDAMKEMHWKKLMEQTGQFFDMNPEVLTLENIFNMDLARYKDTCMEIVANSVKELSIERSINDVEENWKIKDLTIIEYIKNDTFRGIILGDLSEVFQLLEDNIMTLQSMAGSQFIGPFRSVVDKWDKDLTFIINTLIIWNLVQSKWMYLEEIFLDDKFRVQLPNEALKFDGLNQKFKDIMKNALKNRKIIILSKMPELFVELTGLFEGLETCQKMLNKYLETKRISFPRFYFLSDNELLLVLGNTNPNCVQEHIVKMWDNVGSLIFVNDSRENTLVSGMVSCEKEIMEFKSQVMVDGSVEIWMLSVLIEMWRSNKYLIKKSIFEYGNTTGSRCEWMLNYQGQMCLAANSVWWTAEVENVFWEIKKGKINAMKNYLEKLNQQMDELIMQVRGELISNDRKKFNTVLIVDVHARDVIENLVRDGIIKSQEFEWESQLRFYWKKNVDNLIIDQCSGTFSYGYDYMGLNGRLVITPLTDRIYLTITQALSMQLGCAPAGPAGTGKTETVKDLAKALGILCMVTNCGEGMDFQAFGMILDGLCQCGAWGCFDEFNRIDISVLSVISTQLGTIRNALVEKKKMFLFRGRDTILDNKVGIFITMNPGYAGRTELPESLKTLFRPVVCVLPDLELICLIMLFSEGFLNAKVLAKKMAVLYSLAREQLSKQSHYDFGLRALKSVLVIAGELKRNAPNLDENVVLMRALRDMNLPKFVYDDVPLFLGLIADLFPGLKCHRVTYPEFNNAIEEELRKKYYLPLENQVDKVTQLYETMMTRHSTMVVGPTGGGKTVVINTLVNAQTSLGLPTTLYTLNPKACTVVELYGFFNLVTRDWTDGLLSNIFREINKPIPEDKPERRYILFDGDVDALWIENMNSVMDDNKLLTLANGERIRLLPHCALLFEVGDLRYASPATVSRAGMVYVDPKNLGYTPYWTKFLSNKRSVDREPLNMLFDKYVPVILDRIFDGNYGFEILSPLKLIISQTKLNLVTQMCYILDAILSPDSDQITEVSPDTSQNLQDELTEAVEVTDEMEAIFISAIYSSLGAPLEGNSRLIFDEFVKKISGFIKMDDSPSKRASFKFIPCHEETWYEYYLDIEQQIWVPWNTLVPKYEHNPNIKFNEILVPTVDSTRVTWLLNLMTDVKRPVILIGETGTSKTATMQNFLRTLDTNQFMQTNLNFSSRTTSLDVQMILEANVAKRNKNIYGPPIGKKLVCFVDDMNMPQVDTYGTQQPIALLKLFLESGGMYDRGKELIWKSLIEIYLYAAMGKPGSGRNEVDPRFISMFSVYCMVFPSDDTINHIFNSILSGHTHNFNEDVQNIVPTILEMTLRLYKIILVEFPPTPNKFHYIFNLRDLSRIINGMLFTNPIIFDNVLSFVRVWRNEFTRVICDRFNSEQDEQLMTMRIEETLGIFFPNEKNEILINPLIFGDFKNALNEDIPIKLYEDYQTYEAILKMFIEILEEYNEQNQKIDMVLFNMALENLTRIHRVLKMDTGHIMLIGVGGSGKALMTKLAAFTAGCEIFSIVISKGYNEAAFKEDLKRLFLLLGVENKRLVFFLTQSQISEESFLEIINNILMVGTVQALYTEDEKTGIANEVRNTASNAGYENTKDGGWTYFTKTCVNNLHVVLSMSPGDELRERCRNFPGLVNKTYINWIFPWPEQALHAVSESFINNAHSIPQDYKQIITNHIVYTHKTMNVYTNDFLVKLKRKNYVTPKHYLDYINVYLNLIDEKSAIVARQCERLLVGLQKIEEATEQLIILNEQLEIQKVVVAEKTLACEIILQEISEASKIANTKKEIVVEKTIESKEAGKIIAVEKDEAQEILSQALPALASAKDALNNLNKNDITEIRSFATPPEPVQVVTECIALILGYKEVNWKVSKQMMSDPRFLNTLKGLNADDITSKQQSLVRAKLKTSKKIALMKDISKAGYGLLGFVEAVLQYCVVFKEVKPKQDKLKELEKDHELVTKQLIHLNKELNEIMSTLDKLNEKYKNAMAERAIIQEEKDLMERRLIAADKLIAGLSSENTRWKNDLVDLEEYKKKIFGNCLMSSSFLAYTAPFSYEFRVDMLFNNWLTNIIQYRIPITEPFKIEIELADEVMISTWNSEGLPSDDLSIQNGILTTRASRFPLCVDPQQQALNWIKQKEEPNSLKTLSFSDSDYLKYVENAIIYGTPVLFQDVEYIDSIIENVLEKNIKSISGRKFVMLGDKEVDYDEKFRMYLTTKIANPFFSPSIYTKATVINCLITQKGLEDQLLGNVVKNERPDLEQQSDELVMEISSNKSLLKNLEDSLLRELATSTGNILDNIDLVETLEETKSKASEVIEKLSLATTTAIEIDVLRNQFRSAATRGALLFFVLSDMSTINAMYQNSLSSYQNVFKKSLKKAMPHKKLKKRLMNIINTFTESLYRYGCTGIFERHKLLFSFQIAVKLQISTNNVTKSQLDFFIKGNVTLEKNLEYINPISWLSQQNWKDIVKLSKDFSEIFPNLSEHVIENNTDWKGWYDLNMPESSKPPYPFSELLEPFYMLMLLRCFRVDRTYQAISNYIVLVMDEMYITTPTIDYDAIYTQTEPQNPGLFILSPGSDPTHDLVRLAGRCGISLNEFEFLSLGQGQEQIAIKLLSLAMNDGHWLMFQNCHLLINFLYDLEKILDRTSKIHPNFRLWLATEATPFFPVSVLQRSLKVVTEPPNGLKLNIRNTYAKLKQETLDECAHPAYKSLIYVLAFFHAVVQERRKYDKIGWNIAYDFSESDFSVCVQILINYLNKTLNDGVDSTLPWDTLRYLIGNVMYGGRVIDSYDQRIVNTFMEKYFGQFIFDEFQKFYFHYDINISYDLPMFEMKEDYLNSIEELPNINGPEVLGLHFNAEIGYFTKASKNMWDNLLRLQPQTESSDTGESREDSIDAVADDILQKLPDLFVIGDVKKMYGNNFKPSTVVLLQELEIFNILIKKIRVTLTMLRKAFLGEIGMDPILESVSSSLYNGQIPNVWMKLAPQTCKNLGGWIEHFVSRTEQYAEWSTIGEPLVMWLAGLHVPESYLTAIVQMACRTNGWSLDHSTLYTTVTEYTEKDDVENSPNTGCYISGIFIEGARWDMDAQCLAVSKTNILIENLPIILIVPIEATKLKLLNTIRTPVYTTSLRRNAMGIGLVFEADLRTYIYNSFWILQGVCLLLNDD
eukprot:XP_008185630.2 PREDICTED: dynein heavy chain 10, axonemal [Acyrthosiphon pisum]